MCIVYILYAFKDLQMTPIISGTGNVTMIKSNTTFTKTNNIFLALCSRGLTS